MKLFSLAIRFKQAKHVENSYFGSLDLLALMNLCNSKISNSCLIHHMDYASFRHSHSDNAANVILLRKCFDAGKSITGFNMLKQISIDVILYISI